MNLANVAKGNSDGSYMIYLDFSFFLGKERKKSLWIEFIIELLRKNRILLRYVFMVNINGLK